MIRWLLPLCLGAVMIACSGGSNTAPTAGNTATATARPQPNAPQAAVEPRSVPPGAFVTVSGTDWPAGQSVAITGDVAPGQTSAIYANAAVADDGSFQARFRLEKTAGGEALKVGRYDLIARSAGTEVIVPVQVESPRPLRNNEGS